MRIVKQKLGLYAMEVLLIELMSVKKFVMMGEIIRTFHVMLALGMWVMAALFNVR